MKKLILLSTLFFSLLLLSCGGNKQETQNSQDINNVEPVTQHVEHSDNVNKGIGPVNSVTLDDEIDQEMAAKGEEIFKSNCIACHKPLEKHLATAPKGALDRHSPEWIMNMILNPVEMMEKDPVAIKLKEEANGLVMTDMGLSEEDARAVLEYFRTL